MSFWPRFRSWLKAILTRSRTESEMAAELRFHIDSYIHDLVLSGAPREEALRLASIEFGSVEAQKEECRHSLGLRFWDELCADLRFGFRTMRRSPGFTLVAVLTLALGIGANSAMFGIVYGLLYRPLPFPNESRIGVVHMSFSPQNNRRGNLSVADFVDWRSGNTTFERVAAYSPSRFTLTGAGQAEEVAGVAATADFFSVLGVRPILGRLFETGDDSPSGPNLVVISASLWQRRFHGSPGAVGQVIEVNSAPATIVGVVGESYGFPRPRIELWESLHTKVTRRGPFFFQGIGRLRPGATLESAQAETNWIGKSIEQRNPGVYSRLTMPVELLRNFLVGDLRPALFMMFAAVFGVLLIATVNIANLMLAKGSIRGREMAVRLSLGAARRRLLKQVLTESLLLSLTGAGAGLVVAFGGITAFRAFDPAGLPLSYQVQLGWSVVLFTVVTAIGSGVFFSLISADPTARGGLQTALSEGGRSGSASAGQYRTRAVLVVAEIALSLVLLVAAGLLLRSFLLLQKVQIGTSVPPPNLLTMVVTPKTILKPQNSAEGENQTIGFYQRVLKRVSRLPGVQSAAISDSLPPDEEGEDDTFSIAGRPWSPQEFPSTSLPKVSPDYFRALGVPLLRGRLFTDRDTPDSLPVTVISESLARRYFPGVNPVGQKIRASAAGPDNTGPYAEIVGVVGDLKFWGLESEFKPAYYRPYTQDFNNTLFLLVSSPKPASGLGLAIEREIHSEDEDAVVRRIQTLDSLLGESVSQPRFRTLLLTGFGILALLLAAIGIYGVMAYSVTQRTREIGIRMALGAKRSDVLRMVAGNGAFLVACGIAIGLLGSFAAQNFLRRFLFSISANDPLTVVAGCALLAAVALAATMIPAMRATRIDPQIALRHE